MLKPPNGISPRERERDRFRQEITQETARMMTVGAGIEALPVAPTGAGTDAAGHLGFALGMSGFGGDDWLFPSNEEAPKPHRLFNELR